MSLSLGHELGPYEIESAAGAGGMGEVYKAKDTWLDCTVAIKVLPDLKMLILLIVLSYSAGATNLDLSMSPISDELLQTVNDQMPAAATICVDNLADQL